LAVFQGGPTRTGGKAPISESYGSSEQRGKTANRLRPPAAALLVGYVQQQFGVSPRKPTRYHKRQPGAGCALLSPVRLGPPAGGPPLTQFNPTCRRDGATPFLSPTKNEERGAYDQPISDIFPIQYRK
jgi:hypothetical protein